MSEPKMTAEERIAKRTIRVPVQYCEDEKFIEPEDAVDACKEHAAAAVKELKARVAELERERDEARARVAELERIPHDAPTIVEVEEYVYAPGWLDRVRAALGKEAQP